MSQSPRVVDLFCGAGGLSVGLQRAGLDVILAADSWSAAVDTYRTNLRHPVAQIEVAEGVSLPPMDVITGGPPCQGFSSAGARRVDDPRNSLVSTFARVIAASRPKVFLFENVEGFLTAAGGERVFDLLEPLVASGYRIHLRKINAANFGVPQHRKRVIAIGALGWDPFFPKPTHSAAGAPGASRYGSVLLPPAPSVMSALEGLPAPSSAAPGSPPDHYARPLRPDELARVVALKPGMTMKDIPVALWHESYVKRANRRVRDGTPSERRGGAPAGLRRLVPDAPSKAITSGARSDFVHPVAHRPLTLRECARLQTFSDDFVFCGSTSDRATLIGNAVPPRLGEMLGRALVQTLRAMPKLANECPEGALLTFMPTASEGMSPILASLTEDVVRRFGVAASPQLSLVV